MRAEGKQLHEVTKLIESGLIKPVVDKVFRFVQTNEALGYVEAHLLVAAILNPDNAIAHLL